MANDYENRITPQIAKWQNNKKLIELTDRLNPAPVTRYARLHAQGEATPDGRYSYSKIGMTLLDYSTEGQSTKKVTANLDPEDVRRIYNFAAYRLSPTNPIYTYQTEKIFGAPNENGQSHVTKVKIERQPKRKDPKTGEIVDAKSPWYIEVSEGFAIAVKTKQGGQYAQSGSYEQAEKITLNLTDEDFEDLFGKAVAWINVFESVYGSSLITAAYQAKQAGYDS